MRLTKKRKQVLEAIRDLNSQSEFPDHHQIAVACRKDYAAADWAHEPLRDLLSAGYVAVVGRRFAARTWKITEEGRSALNGLAFP